MLHSPKATTVHAVLLAIPLLGAWTLPAQAQTAYQVKDILVDPGTSVSASYPSELVEISNVLYFVARDPANGRELWRSDGTPGGTRLLKEIQPGPEDNPFLQPQELVSFRNTLFFSTLERLWRSDGTTAGTVEFASFSGNFTPTYLTPADGNLFFMVGRELWRSDGTTAGTSPLHTFDLTVQHIVASGPRVFIFVDSGPTDLWVSDGTAAGTSRVTQVCSGDSEECQDLFSFSTTSRKPTVQPVGGALLFAGRDSGSGAELWKSDGTASGTGPVTDIVAGPGGSQPRDLAAVGGTLFFSAADASGARALWVSDGTALGTRKVKDVPAEGIASVNGTAFFYGFEPSTGWEPWRSDGTAAGTSLVKDVCAGDCDSWLPYYYYQTFRESAGRAYFTSREREVWSTDGTAVGTRLTHRINDSSRSLHPFEGAGSPMFYFRADDELWTTDGSTQPPVQLTSAEGDVSSNPLELTRLNDGVYFSVGEVADASARSLWYSGGDAPSTFTVFNGGRFSSSTRHTPFLGRLLFAGGDPTGLWIVDKPTLPARRLTDGSIQGRIVVSNGQAFFGKSGGLWVTDGTVAGTRLIASFPNNGSPDEMTAAGSFVFLTVDGSLWRTDGTPQGTIPLLNSPTSFNLFAFKGALYFNNLNSILKSDGTPAGTVEAVPGRTTRSAVTVIGDRFYFASEDSGGFELWGSDGTAPGTARVKDIWPGPAGSLAYAFPDSLVMSELGGNLYFAADDGTHGLELWRSDGTESGTVMVKDIAPGRASSVLSDLTNIYGTLYMAATDGLTGREVWRSDGTNSGTFAVEDIAPGAASSNPAHFTPAGRTVFFTADDGETGTELWAFPVLSHDIGLLKTPAPGGALTSATATWTWYPGDETLEYWLTIKNLTTGQVLYNASQGAGLSRTVAGLPIDGGLLLVRLWSRLAQGWQVLDYTYTAAVPRPATMVSPVPGAALNSSVVTFTWEAGAGATAYWLYVGTTPGGKQIYPGSQVTSLSATVSGIPTTGAPVYVRLFSLIGGVWQHIDYSYTTGGPAVSLTVSATTVSPGQTVQVTLQGGPGNLRDWIGLHASAAADATYLDWKYLNGTRTTPTTALTSATLTYTMPTTAGTYNFRLFQNGGFTKLATSPTVTVGAVANPVLNVAPTSLAFGDVAAGSTLDKTVVVKNTGGGTLSGTGSVTGTGYSIVGTASYSLTANQEMTLTVRFAPTAAGSANGTLTLTGGAGASVPLTGNGTSVGPSVTIVGGVATVAPGATVQVQVSNGPGLTKDWVGLHLATAADTVYVDWKYLSGTRTAPATGLTSATLTFTMPTAPGAYQFRFFSNNTFARLAISATVTVTTATTPTLTVSTTTATPGQVVQVTLANGPGNLKDWIGLYASGAANTSYSSWYYLNGTRTAPTVGLTAATVAFAMPTTPGTYEFRFFQNNTYTRLATSPTVTVQ